MSRKRKLEWDADMEAEEERKRKELKKEAEDEALAWVQVKRVQANCAEWARLLPLMVGRVLSADEVICDMSRHANEGKDLDIVLTGPTKDVMCPGSSILASWGWDDPRLQEATLLVEVPVMFFICLDTPAACRMEFAHLSSPDADSLVSGERIIRLRLEALVEFEKRLLFLERLLLESSPLAGCAGVIRLVVAYA